MVKRCKTNKRPKAILGLIGAGIGALGSIISSAIGANSQKKINEENIKAQNLANANALNTQYQNNMQQQANNSYNDDFYNKVTLDTQNRNQFDFGGKKPILRRKYKTYTDPYAKDWYLSIFRKNNFKPIGVLIHENNQAALNAADYVESMYRYHQKKYLHNRDSVENAPTFVGAPSPKGYIPNTIKESLQFENYNSRNFGPYNDNYPDLPLDYNKYKCGGKKRMKCGGNATSYIRKTSKFI